MHWKDELNDLMVLTEIDCTNSQAIPTFYLRQRSPILTRSRKTIKIGYSFGVGVPFNTLYEASQHYHSNHDSHMSLIPSNHPPYLTNKYCGVVNTDSVVVWL